MTLPFRFLGILLILSTVLIHDEVDCGYKKQINEWSIPHYPVKHYEYYEKEKCCKDKIVHVPVVKKVHIPVVKHIPYPVIKKKVVIKKIKVPVPVIKKKIVYKKVLVKIPVHHHHVVIKKKEKKKKKKKKKCKEPIIKPEKVKKMAKEVMESYEKIKEEKDEPCEKKKKKKSKKKKKKSEYEHTEWPYSYPIAHTYGHDIHIPPAHWPPHIPWM